MTTDPPEPKARRKWHFYKWLVLLIVATFAYAQWRVYTFRAAIKEARALGWAVVYTDPYIEVRKNWKTAFKKETWLARVTSVIGPTGEMLSEHRALIQRLNPKSLSIRETQSLRDLSALKGHTGLESLHIEFPSSLTDLDGLQNLTALEYIYIYNAHTLTNVDGLKKLLAVKRLILKDATKLTNVDVLKNLSALVDLELHYCTGLTNVDGLKNCKKLQTVHLVRCTGLKNVDGLKNLPALYDVWLLGCSGLTKESIDALRATFPKTNVVIKEPRFVPKPTKPNTTSGARDTDGQPVNTDTPPLAPKPIKPPPTNGESSPRL